MIRCKTTKTSVLGAINMLGLAKRLKAKVLQVSTSEVYGDPEIHPRSEPGLVTTRANVARKHCFSTICESTDSQQSICGARRLTRLQKCRRSRFTDSNTNRDDTAGENGIRSQLLRDETHPRDAEVLFRPVAVRMTGAADLRQDFR